MRARERLIEKKTLLNEETDRLLAAGDRRLIDFFPLI
jgi:hypothetical protein